MASTSISKATPGTPTNNKKFTFSFWVKRHKLGSNQNIYIHERGSGYSHTHKVEFGFHSSDSFFVGTWNGSAEYYSRTKRKFKDTNAWYHCMVVVDSTQSTNTNRLKWYFNGEQYSIDGAAFDAGPSYPAQNWVFDSNTWTHNIGRYVSSGGASNYLDASLSDFCFVDGLALTPSSFGETDTDTGEWRMKDFAAGDITWGTNGYRILKDGNSLTDVSSNSHNFTADTGTLTKTEDCPNNVFCTGNPLARYSGNVNYSNGNNFITGSANNWTMGSATMGASTGKWYYELKMLTAGTGSGYFKMGFQSADQSYAGTGHTAESGLDASYAFYNQQGNLEVRTDGAVISGYDTSTLGVSFSMNDVMCLAIDMDNKKAYFRKNGDAWIKSANPVNGTNGLDISSEYPAGKGMVPNFAIYYPGTAAVNFGNGYFGTTAVSSAGSNASNNGIFEFDVPTGYTALSTKGLNL